jgi:iron(III) transport system permease protein
MTSKSLQSQWQQGRTLLAVLACLLAALALFPLGGLIGEGMKGLLLGTASLGADGLIQIRGTSLLLLGTASLGAVLGSSPIAAFQADAC